MSLEENYSEVKAKVREICEKTGRNPEDVKIIAVSKTFPISKIMDLNQLGQYDFGENRIRELRDKYYNISFQYGEKINWHMIGHLQTRKVKDIVAFIHLIHSVDSYELAAEIDARSKQINKIIDILVQVNTSNEPQKSGLIPEDTLNVCRQIRNLNNVRIKGLMTMAKLTEDTEEIRGSFRSLKKLFDGLKSEFRDMEHLSMGMSHDYEIAIEEGATMLRIGSAIFGNRTV